MNIAVSKKQKLIISIEIEADQLKPLRNLLAAECEKRFDAVTPADKPLFDFLSDVEYELRKEIYGT